MVHQVNEYRGVTGLAGTDEYDQRAAMAVNELVDLRADPAAGAAQGVIERLDAQILVLRSCPLRLETGSPHAGGRG